MDVNKIPLLAALTRHMTWLTQRQTVLSQNIANMDTPGYRPRDVARPDFKAFLARESRAAGGDLRPAVTDPAHLALARASGAFPVRDERRPAEVTLDGNAVSMEEELMKVSETAMEYDLSTSLYNKHVSMIRQALGRQR